jgi:hypothetical protein
VDFFVPSFELFDRSLGLPGTSVNSQSVKDYNCSLCRMKRICDALEAMMQFQQQEQDDSLQYLGGFME